MNCSDFEQQIALYVEEDLSAAERGRVAAHLRECSTCWDLAEDLKESQAVFKSIRQDIPDATALSALRERVLSRVSGLETMTWFERFVFGSLRRKAALAGVALVLVGSGALWLTRSVGLTPVVVSVDRAPLSVVPAPVSEPRPTAVPSRPALAPTRAPRPAPEVAEAPETTKPSQVAIQFVTDDPKVIIYWLVDEKGD